MVQNQCLRSHSNYGVVRDNSLSPTKGKGPFSATLSPTISPELRFAVANVPQRSKVGDLDIRTGQYNEKLREAIPKWSLPSSPVELVEFMEAYSCK